MRGNWIQHTATGGIGALTLLAVANCPGFNNVFPNAQTYVDYEIDDGNGNFEAGIGLIDTTGGSPILTRTDVEATFTGSTYTKVSATALAFSGAVNVRCAPLANSFVGAPQFFYTGTGTALLMPGNVPDSAPTATGLAADTVYYVPFEHKGRFPITKAGVYCETSVAGASVEIGLYRVGSNGLPDRLLCDFGNLAPVTSGNTYTNSDASWITQQSPLWLPTGWYWAAFLTGATAPIIAGAQYISNQLSGLQFERQTRYLVRGTATPGALAALAANNGASGYTAVANLSAPILYLGP